jgi:cbb3-type cytochrome oxidase subunit 3
MKASVIMELISYFTMFIMILFFVAVAIFLFELQHVNNFQQTVNHTIERHGGLTTEALIFLETHSNEHFRGRFTVFSEESGIPKSFGESVAYTIEVDIPILFFPIPSQLTTFRGTAVSQVR